MAGFLFVTAGLAAENRQWEELFFTANQAYREGRFQEAVEGYRLNSSAGNS